MAKNTIRRKRHDGVSPSRSNEPSSAIKSAVFTVGGLVSGWVDVMNVNGRYFATYCCTNIYIFLTMYIIFLVGIVWINDRDRINNFFMSGSEVISKSVVDEVICSDESVWCRVDPPKKSFYGFSMEHIDKKRCSQ